VLEDSELGSFSASINCVAITVHVSRGDPHGGQGYSKTSGMPSAVIDRHAMVETST